MLFRLILLFTIIPVIEIYLLIKVGSLIGGLPTAALLLAISLLGAWLVRSQGFRIFLQIRDELSRGRLPAAQLMDGALVLVGGVLLMTPGFFTDFLGIFFLIPATRRLIKLWLGLWLQRKLAGGGFVTRRHY
ncbi:MAG TPA: FxsA family protein [Geomonas sp.]|nr:FxsA family protein [Geomonas sp.]